MGAQLVGNPGKPTTFDALNSGTNGTSSSTRPLFRAAILQSGAPGGVPIANPSEKDAQFRRVLHSTRCAKADAGIHARLACLRALDWHTLNNANLAEQVRASNTQGMKYILGSYPWTATLDGGPDHGGLFADIPSKLLDRGDFANVPLLNGDCLDEGTIFAPQGLFNEDEFAHWFKSKSGR